MTQDKLIRAALARKTVVCVGVGGARSYLENLARAGVGRFVLIDGDRVERSNLRTQAVFPDEAGAFKTELVAAQLRRIHPQAHITALPRFLDNTLDDQEFNALIGAPLMQPRDVLLVGCTDSFLAQARTAALALNLGTPYLAAQLYREGLAAELYFSYPGVTIGGCARCALASRYDAYLKNGYQNQVTSRGADIFATERVNALKGMMTLAILLFQEPEAGHYAELLQPLRARNFALLRLSPLAGRALGLGLFDMFDRCTGEFACFDETIWVPQHPNHPQYGETLCPLCGGEPDLSQLAGTIADTRLLA